MLKIMSCAKSPDLFFLAWCFASALESPLVVLAAFVVFSTWVFSFALTLESPLVVPASMKQAAGLFKVTLLRIVGTSFSIGLAYC